MPSLPQSASPGKWQRRTFVNDQIKSYHIALLDENNRPIGTYSRIEALSMASSQWLDLIQIRYDLNSQTSTCMIADYGKYQYDKKKSDAEKRKSQSKGMKELEFGYSTTEHDLDMKIKKWKELLSEGYQLRFVVKLRGRENIYREVARDKMQFIIDKLVDCSKSQGIKGETKWFSVVLNFKK